MDSATASRMMRCLLAGVVTCTLFCGCAASPVSHDAVRVGLIPYFRGLRTVDVRIDGATYSFLVDTAGGRTLISPRLAGRLGCTPRGRDVGYRMNGDPVVFKNCPRLDATIAGYHLLLEPVATFDLGSLLPAELPALDGVLALDAFRGRVVTFDWRANELVVAGRAVAERPPDELPLRFATGENGAALSVLLPVRGLQPMWFLLDSGDIRGTLLGRHAVTDGLAAFVTDSTSMISVGSGSPESLTVIVDDINFDGVLGTDFLQSRAVTLDLRDAPAPQPAAREDQSGE